MKNIVLKPILVVAGAFVGLALALAVAATAGDSPQADPFSTQVIPYDGVLELDGLVVNGTYHLRFSLFETPTEGALVWEDVMTVEVVAGRFSVLFGSGAPLEPEDFRHDGLYLSIAIEDPEEAGTYFTLANRQRIVPTPYSYIASEAPDFLVNESLTVTEDASVGGDLTVAGHSELGSLGVSQSLSAPSATIGALTATDITADSVSIDDTLTAPAATFGDLSVTGTATVAALTAGPTSVQGLTSAGNIRNTNPDGLLEVSRDFALRDTGDNYLRLRDAADTEYRDLAVHLMWVQTDLVASGNSRSSCAWVDATCGNSYCPNDKYMAGFDDGGLGCGRIYCCEL